MEWVGKRKPRRLQGGRKTVFALRFGEELTPGWRRAARMFMVRLKDGQYKMVVLHRVSKFNLPKVRAWWRNNVEEWSEVQK